MDACGQQRAVSIQQCLCHMDSPGCELLRFSPTNRWYPSHQHAPICAHSQFCPAFPVRQVPVLTQGVGGAETSSQSSALWLGEALWRRWAMLGADSCGHEFPGSCEKAQVPALHDSGLTIGIPSQAGF